MSGLPVPKGFLIVAHALNGVIGNKGSIPWHAPHDLRHFKRLTAGAALVMGRSTWESLPQALERRESIVVSSNQATGQAAFRPTFESAVKFATELRPDMPIAFIGGSRIYAASLALGWVTDAFVTTVHLNPEGDTFFEPLGPDWTLTDRHHSGPDQHPACDFSHYIRPRRSS